MTTTFLEIRLIVTTVRPALISDHSAKVQARCVWIPARRGAGFRRAPGCCAGALAAAGARANRGGHALSREEVTADHARLWLAGGALAELDRARCRAELQVPDDATDGAIIHPYLAPVALVMARWLGREGFHGGGIVAGGGVWGVLGDKTAGKSTTLAWLARAGVGVVSDDVLIVDGETGAGRSALDRPARGGRPAARRRRADRPRRRARSLARCGWRRSRRELPLRGLDHARVGRRGRGRADPRRRAPRGAAAASRRPPRAGRARRAGATSARSRTCG